MTVLIGTLSEIIGIFAGLIAIWLGVKVLREDKSSNAESQKHKENRDSDDIDGNSDDPE